MLPQRMVVKNDAEHIKRVWLFSFIITDSLGGVVGGQRVKVLNEVRWYENSPEALEKLVFHNIKILDSGAMLVQSAKICKRPLHVDVHGMRRDSIQWGAFNLA